MYASDFYPLHDSSIFCDDKGMDADDFVTRLKRKIDQDPDLTPAGLAVLSGIDNSTIRKLLSGANQSPKVATAQKICKALGTTLEAFMSDDHDNLRAEILALYSQLSDDERLVLQSVAKGLLSRHREEG
jgi:transcriptional regulator with XRE-family HTH domain